MVEVSWTLQSLEDIENIAEYIAKDSVKYAQIQVQEFFKVVKLLEEYPKAGRIVPELSNKSIREIIVGAYRIIYRIVSAQKIDILNVHHSYKLLKKRTVKKNK
ncbi:MAG: type II toxin-antitoxin system RelE/ParE family toxin [Bacteroidota bacterium]|nr:type II toxin-antitoxin system RelE/ParE family toxin [Bacteroidota bacterium]